MPKGGLIALAPRQRDLFTIQVRFVPLGPAWSWYNFFTCQDELAAQLWLAHLKEPGHEYRAIKND